MDTEADTDAQLPGASLLLIIGEPFSDDHKKLIIEEIARGFKSWDPEDSGIDIHSELSSITEKASLGEEGANGERLIQHQSDKLSIEILINPLTQSLKHSLKKLLIVPSPNKYVFYAGHAFQGTGSWILQDDVFSFNSFMQTLRQTDVEASLKQNMEASLTLVTPAPAAWGAAISANDAPASLRIQLNPSNKAADSDDSNSAIDRFVAYVGTFVVHTPVTNLLQASEQFGNISFTRPTLYIFPGCQGDSALFGINGFNLLVNGGYNRKACFWDFARHLDRVDAMLLTHLGVDNIFGINTALQRKSVANIHPQIGYLFFNALSSARAPSPVEEEADKPNTLLINLAEEANNLTNMAKSLGITPQSCYRNPKGLNAEPINLYHKLGHGSLDMYILNPVSDSKEVKEFQQNWSKKAHNLGSSGPFPLENATSVCTMLVWKPHNPTEKIVRILFPGNTPLHKVAEGLEKMKSFAYLKHATCTQRDLNPPKPVKKPAAAASAARPGSASAKSSRTARSEPMTTSTTSSRRDSPRKPAVPTAGRASPTKARDAPAKKPAVPTAKDAATKTTSASRPTASSQGKSATPKKPASPTKSPASSKSPSPQKSSDNKSPNKTKSPEPEKPKSPTKSPEPKPANASLSQENPNVAQDLKPESDQAANLKPESDQAVPDEKGDKATENNNDPKILDNIKAEVDESNVKNEIPDIINGHSNGNQNGEAEEERPQALPDPPCIGLPDYSSQYKSDKKELSDFDKIEKELEDVQISNVPHKDPAEDIPSSPEPSHDDTTDLNDYTIPEEIKKTFETPVFANDDEMNNGSVAMEQNIQYGIDKASRSMSGILEEEEPDEDSSSIPAAFDRDSSPETENPLQNGEVKRNGHNSFDPVSEWGQPMGLPSPPPPGRGSSRPGSARPTSARGSASDAKKRPGTAPARAGAGARGAAGSKRPGSSRTSPVSSKVPPLPPMTAFYMDLSYIPNHGELVHSDVEFFKRIRARYYVMSALSPNLKALDSLLEAKATWEQKDLEVTVICTYDNEYLRHWVGLNKEKMADLGVVLTPAVSRCTIQLQDLETSLPAYRLEV